MTNLLFIVHSPITAESGDLSEPEYAVNLGVYAHFIVISCSQIDHDVFIPDIGHPLISAAERQVEPLTYR